MIVLIFFKPFLYKKMSIFEEYGAFKFRIYLDYMCNDNQDGTIHFHNYSQTSLSRTRLFRITAYLEVKIWSMF